MPPPRASTAEFDALFSSLLARLYRRAVLLTGETNAEDVVHEVYLKLVGKPSRLVDHPEPYAYAFRAMVSVVRDVWRRDERLVLTPEVDERLPGDTFGDHGRDAEMEVVRLLRGLSAKQASVVILVDLDGYTVDQAAEFLGVHRGTVSRSRQRAIAKLRQTIEMEDARQVTETETR
ncbi:RNA polymerase sigma factor [Sphaerisporangium dianthi]|uniref:RNA polymerase sigma factor n=1 Tax=Sphaerisporangium dianthi TaxID=1436120 RepID=A0ABV9CHQ4_9ACTN